MSPCQTPIYSIRTMYNCRYAKSHPLASSIYLVKCQHCFLFQPLTADLLRHSIHPLTRKFETDLQQLLRDSRPIFLHLLPLLLVQHPCHAIPLGMGGRRPNCRRKEG